ncbi:lipopolysaccharide biosynthesis protein [Geodermatophilus sp. SYSU D01036]
MSIVVVHSLGPTEYARFAVYVAVFAVVLPALNGGISEATMQWLASMHATGDRSGVTELVRRCAGYHLLVQGPITALVTWFLLRDAALPFLFVAVGSNVAYAAVETSSVVLMGTARNALVARFGLVMNLASSVAVAGTATTQHTATATWAVQVAATTIGPLLAFLALPSHMRRAVLTPLLPWRFPVGFRTYAVSAYLSGLVGILVFGRSEIFVLELQDAVLPVALYAVATTVAGKITVLVDSVMGPIAPASAALVASAPHLAERALARALRTSALLGGASAALILPSATILLGPLFGETYEAAEGAFIALGLVSCVQSVASPLNAFAFATRSAPGILRINIICLAVDAALAFSLIPSFGLTGAVIANCGAQMLSLALTARLVARRTDSSLRMVARSSLPFVSGPIAAAVALAAGLSIPSPIGGVLVALAAGSTVLLLFLMTRPALRLEDEDAQAIETALPAVLRKVFSRMSTRLPLVRRARDGEPTA